MDATDRKAKRYAKSLGLNACKSRSRKISTDNQGGFQLSDDWNDYIIAGFDFDLVAEDVIDLCREIEEQEILSHPSDPRYLPTFLKCLRRDRRE